MNTKKTDTQFIKNLTSEQQKKLSGNRYFEIQKQQIPAIFGLTPEQMQLPLSGSLLASEQLVAITHFFEKITGKKLGLQKHLPDLGIGVSYQDIADFYTSQNPRAILFKLFPD